MLYALILGNLMMVGLYALKAPTLPPQIPLFFSKPWGEDQLGEIWMLAFLPITMNLFIFLNRFVAGKLFTGNRYITSLLSYANYFLIAVFVFVFIQIVFLIS